MKKSCFYFASMFLFYSGEIHAISTGSLQVTHGSDQEIDMKMINSQIESLTNLKEYYLTKAARVRNLGDRLQFSSHQDGLITAQKCWQSADEYDRISDQIQEEINNLEKEKRQVLKKADY